ncbi:baseplate assembly protein [Chitinimonas sp. BJB300]|uniref:baseplate assembly protein n=1 Tax=Chitinimonas sp. BJB300 TaxID=1559339 RepID=UPI000C0C9395|nr:baseplate J/gp47 family protein [Chitinimonas sp. BJB300]PHV11314.1 baseplate assembly protein [Chitinimonas sp. BJB300]TSJ88207.1 baseplate assembly protein [Chitinimonas sp. BJB300]
MIDINALPAPKVVEPLDYETLFSQRKAALLARQTDPERAKALAATLALESEPLTILLQESAYREVLLRQRINDASLAGMLAYATGADLDHRAAEYGVARLIVQPADPLADPPRPAVMESDDRLRYRTQLALEGFSTAGPVGSYVYHALSASAAVADVAIDSPSPGQVRVTVLDSGPSGIPAASQLDTVTAALNAETVRPLCDTVLVEAATVTAYTVVAQLYVTNRPESAPAPAAARAKLDAYLAARRKLGADVPLSGLYAALHQPGIVRVVIQSPSADILTTPRQAALCTAITLTTVNTDEI